MMSPHDPPADVAGDADESDEPLVPFGNPLRLTALVPLVAGSLVAVLALLVLPSARQYVPVVLVGTLVVAVAVLDLLGSFDDPPSTVAHRAAGRSLLRPAALAAGSALVLFALLRLAVRGDLPVALSAAGLPLCFLLLVVGVFRLGEALGPWRLDETGRARPLHRRHGFWVVCAATLIYLPMLGNHSLIDPWEPHYGEVAREILSRNDWISLWWAQDGWFWSKPVLSIWLQAIAMALLGVGYEPGRMLDGLADGRVPQPEWAVRMPIFLCALLALYWLYKAVASSHGRRAGAWAALVLLTMPQWFFVTHQTMTDMPFVAGLTGAAALFLCGVHTSPDEEIATYALRLPGRTLHLSLHAIVLGAILVVVVPQVLYLLSRNVQVELEPMLRVRFGADLFTSGSPHACGLPGNDVCREGLEPVVKRFEPALQALVWLQLLALLLWTAWGERRRQRLLFLAAWLLAAVSTMSKGPAGLVLPVLGALGYVAGARRWRELARMELVAGLLVVAVTVLPWIVASYVRHGQPFTDRLLFHDMYKRAFRHVHDTNTGDDVSFRYYLWQLGYATFPWSGLAALGAVRWLARSDGSSPAARATTLVMGGWLVGGFALFAVMGTKFHHYCLPLVPPLAALTGVLLDQVATSVEDGVAEPLGERLLLGAGILGAAVVTLLVGRDLSVELKGLPNQIRLVHLFSYNYGRPWPETLDFLPALKGFSVGATALTLALVAHRARALALGAMGLVAALFAAWGLNVYFVQISPHWGQRELFVAYEQHNLHRPGPLVAYQLNWKGENFYRGNVLPAFVTSGEPFKTWVAAQKRAGQSRFYFVTEHTRVGGLKNELGRPSQLDKLTDTALNNKFVLVVTELD